MRPVIALALVGAATSALAQSEAPARLRGCWLQRQGSEGEIVTTLRWRVGEHGVWIASEIVMGLGVPWASPNRVERWELRAVGSGFQLCGFDMLFRPLRCYDASFRPQHAVSGARDRAELEITDKSLRISLVIEGRRTVHFDGIPCGPGWTD
jgi:hypothetical protein